jgi:hypothetical protein
LEFSSEAVRFEQVELATWQAFGPPNGRERSTGVSESDAGMFACLGMVAFSTQQNAMAAEKTR